MACSWSPCRNSLSMAFVRYVLHPVEMRMGYMSTMGSRFAHAVVYRGPVWSIIVWHLCFHIPNWWISSCDLLLGYWGIFCTLSTSHGCHECYGFAVCWSGAYRVAVWICIRCQFIVWLTNWCMSFAWSIDGLVRHILHLFHFAWIATGMWVCDLLIWLCMEVHLGYSSFVLHIPTHRFIHVLHFRRSPYRL